MVAAGTQPCDSVTWGYISTNGGYIQESGVSVDMGGSSTPTPATVTQTFVATTSHTAYGTGEWPSTQISITTSFFQGYTSGSHHLVGELWFSGLSALYGKTILSAKLLVRRETGGFGDVVEITAYYGDLAYNAVGSLDNPVSIGKIGKIGNTGTKAFTIPTSAVSYLAGNPTGRCIAFNTGESSVSPSKSYSRNYAKFNGVGSAYVPEIVVTYVN
jgi:hypothetical protein